MSLNPEPAAPEERAELNLEPKSYADAAEQALEPESPSSPSSPHVNGTDGTADHSKYPPKSETDRVKPNGIKTAMQDQTERLEGVGLDASPKSPTAKGHRRKGSRSSMGSIGRKHGEQMMPMDSDVFVEKHPNSHGDALVSVKPAPAQDKKRRIDVKRRNSELKSGRQAGAGWATSKCVSWAAWPWPWPHN
jgi:hypothetical protein